MDTSNIGEKFFLAKCKLMKDYMDEHNLINTQHEYINNIIRYTGKENKADFLCNEENFDYIYTKPWSRIPTPHKWDRLKKFAGEDRRMMSKLKKALNENKLNSSKVVEYDQSSKKIIKISLPNL